MTAITDDTTTPDVHDNMAAARMAGYSWDDINGHLQDSTDQALAAGYSQPEIDQHLGNADPKTVSDGLTARAAVAGSHEEADPSAGSVDYQKLGTDNPAVQLSEDQKREYANALRTGAVKSPEDFGKAFGEALDLDADQAAKVARDAAAQLPHFEDLTDHAIRIAHDADMEVNPATVRGIRNNMLDRWAKTGESPSEQSWNAYQDPAYANDLIKTPGEREAAQPDMSELEKQGKDAIKYHDPLSEIQHIDITGMVGLAAGYAELPSALKAHDAKIEQMRANGADPEDIADAQKDNPAYNLAFGTLAAAVPLAHGVVKVLPPEVGGVFKDLWHDEAGNINVWHGTPHLFHEAPEEGAPFGKFELSAIGSGEGAQAYGHGLYFAENKSIAEHYQKALAGNEFTYKDEPTDTQQHGLEWLRTHGHPDEIEDNKRFLQDRLIDETAKQDAATEASDPELYAARGALISRLEKDYDGLKSLDPEKIQKAPGHLYEAHIDAEPEHFLDWDKPLSEQSPHVQEALKKMFPEDYLLDKHDPGEAIYHKAGQGMATDQEKSEALAKAGIPGIRYLDASSRHSEMREQLQGAMDRQQAHLDAETNPEARKIYETDIADYKRQLDELPPEQRNHVVFDPKIIKITGRDGEPVPTPAQALGQVAANGLRQRLTKLMDDLLYDQSGSLNLFKTQREVALAGRNAQAKADTRAEVQAGRGERNQWLAMAKGGLEEFRKVVNKGRDEHEAWVAGQGPGHSNFDPTTGQWDISQHQALIDHMEGRASPVKLDPNSPLRPLADVMRDQNKRMADMMKATPGFDEDGHINWKDDYYRHQWQDPAKMSAAFAGREGSSASFRERTIPYQYDALALGHKPVHVDPIENQLSDLMGKMDWRRLHINRENMVAREDAKWSHTGAPEGMVPLDGNSSARIVKWVDPNTGEAEVRQQRLYAYPGAASAYNAEVGGGIYRMLHTTSAKIWDKIQQYNNMTIGAMLGGPIYHTFNMAVESLTSGIMGGVDASLRGEVFRGLWRMGTAATVLPRVMLNAVNGRSLEQAWKDSTSHPALQPVVAALRSADYRFSGRSSNLDIRMGDRELPGWIKMISEGDVKRQLGLNFGRVFGPEGEPGAKTAALAMPRVVDAVGTEVGRLMKMAMYPIMEKVVPWVRNGAAMMSMQDFLRRNPTASEAEIQAHAGKISNRVDNTFGEMNLDNLFMKRAVRQALQVTPVSLGWALGTYRAVGSGVGDLLKGLGKAATIRNPVDKLLSENARWLIAFPMGQALINSILQYAYTGQTPLQTDTPFRDMMNFRTSGKLPSGQPERGVSWGYGKDWMKWGLAAFSPGNALDRARETAKTIAGSFINNPLANISHDLYTGKDWADRNIRSIVQALNHGKEASGLQELWYILKTNLNPMVLSQIAQQKAGSALGAFSHAIGLREAPRAMEDPQGYKSLMDTLHGKDVQNIARQLLKQEQGLANPDSSKIDALQDALTEIKGQLGGGGGGGGSPSIVGQRQAAAQAVGDANAPRGRATRAVPAGQDNILPYRQPRQPADYSGDQQNFGITTRSVGRSTYSRPAVRGTTGRSTRARAVRVRTR